MKHSARIALVVLTSVAGLMACAGGPRLMATSGIIGCPPKEIEFADGEMFTGTWTASCRGHLYHCASHDVDNDGKSEVVCKEDLQPVPCKAVACVDPNAPAPAPTPTASPSPRPHW